MNSWFFKLLILAILIRLLVSPFYFHPDIKTYHFQASFLKGGVFNIYQYLADNKERLAIKEDFVYFPLTYFFLGGYQILVSPLLGGNFPGWVSSASQSIFSSPEIFRYLLILKFPYLLLDIAIAFMLMKLFAGEEQKRRVFTLWLFNPLSIIIIYMFSNVDILPVIFTVLSLLLVNKKRFVLAALSLGVGAAFKAYPIILVPFLLTNVKTLREKTMILVASLGVFLLSILPFLSSASFRDSTLASGLTTRLFQSGFGIGFGESLMVGIVALSFIYFYYFMEKNQDKEGLYKYFMIVFLLLYSFIHFHVQWLLWVIPFVIIILVKRRETTFYAALLGIIAFLIPTLYEDRFMSIGLLFPVSTLFNLLPLPSFLVSKVYDPFIVQSALHSILLGGSLVLAMIILKRSER